MPEKRFRLMPGVGLSQRHPTGIEERRVLQVDSGSSATANSQAVGRPEEFPPLNQRCRCSRRSRRSEPSLLERSRRVLVAAEPVHAYAFGLAAQHVRDALAFDMCTLRVDPGVDPVNSNLEPLGRRQLDSRSCVLGS